MPTKTRTVKSAKRGRNKATKKIEAGSADAYALDSHRTEVIKAALETFSSPRSNKLNTAGIISVLGSLIRERSPTELTDEEVAQRAKDQYQDIYDVLVVGLLHGWTFGMTDVGVLSVTNTPAMTRFNIQKKRMVSLPPRKSIKFRPVKALVKLVNDTSN